MFDLEREIRAWSEAIHANGCKRHEHIEELMDHLYCAIERLQEEGLSEKEAFLEATKRMGHLEDLTTEHAKNSSPWSVRYDTAQCSDPNHPKRMTQPMNPKIAALLNISVSIVFALAILLSAYVMDDKNDSQTVMFVLIGLWWIPFSYLSVAATGKQRSIQAEYRCMKRKVSSLLNG